MGGLVKTLEEVSRCDRPVMATKTIHPNPLESDGRIVQRGEVGLVEDVDFCNGVAFVDFSGYIAMVTPEDIR